MSPSVRTLKLDKRFEFVDHTADVGIIAHGKDLAEAFANAAYGLFSIMTDPAKVAENLSHEIVIDSDDVETLLFDWLNELIYIFDTRNLVFRRFEITGFSDQHLKAFCHGERYDPARHHLKLGVKAATYHMLQVDRQNNRVRVIFDV